MVAVVTGSGLGLERSSGYVLGSRGQWGSSTLGRYGENITVNAATGNLFVNRVDQILVGVGKDVAVERSYNSLATGDADNQDNWRLNSQRRIIDFVSGVSVTRTDWDGSNVTYEWDGSAYVSRSGGGAYDTLTPNNSTSPTSWTWTDGTTQASETYATYTESGVGTYWRLGSQLDNDGNVQYLTYTGNKLTQIRSSSGEYTYLVWSGDNLSHIYSTYKPTTAESSNASFLFSMYDAAFDRVPDDAGFDQYFKSLNNGTKTVPAFGDDVYASAEFQAKTFNGVAVASLSNADFVEFLYQTVLNRASDSSGKTTNIAFLTNGGTRAALLLAFAQSQEHLNLLPGLGRVPPAQFAINNTRYEYDTSNRLTKVLIDKSPFLDLTPTNSLSTVDANFITIQYSYDSTSDRITSINQTGGSSLTIEYTTDGSYRVAKLTEIGSDTGIGNGMAARVTQFAYAAGVTTITDALGQTSKIYYQQSTDNDLDRALWKIELPPAQTGDAPQVVEFGYNSNGDLISATDTSGKLSTYTYDARGNILSATDPAGNVVNWTYGSENQILSETRYTNPAAGANPASGALTTRFAYDAELHLRFTISPEGNITEYIYDSFGEPTSVIDYRDNDFSGTDYSESAIVTWTTQQQRDTVERSRTIYDFRGAATAITTWSATTTAGDPTASSGATSGQVNYVYDQFGRLLMRTTAGVANVETFVYDGLDRLIGSVDQNGSATNIAFTDGSNSVAMTFSNGLVQSSVYNAAGQLLSFAQSGAEVAISTKRYEYDALGRVRREVEDNPGSVPDRFGYHLYDKVGRKIADISSDGSLTEYDYDSANRLVATIGYQTKLTAAKLALLTDTNGQPLTPDIAQLRPSADAGDVWNWRIYDNADRVIQTIDGNGATTVYTYDGLSNLVSTRSYYNAVSAPGSNRLHFTEFENGTQGWILAYDYNGIHDAGWPQTGSNLNGTSFIKTQFTATAAGQQVSMATGAAYRASVTAGEQISIQAGVEAYGVIANVLLAIAWIDAAGNQISAPLVGQKNGPQTFNTKIGKVFTVPVNAVEARLELYATTSGSGTGSFNIIEPIIAGTTGSTVVNYNRGMARSDVDAGGNAYNYGNISGFKTKNPTTLQAVRANDAKDAIARSFYDGDGNVVGALDANGYVTQRVYNGSGEVVRIVRYANNLVNGYGGKTAAQIRASGTFAEVLGAVGTNSRDITTRYFYDGQGRLRIALDANSRPTEYIYDRPGNVTTRVDYGASIASPASTAKLTDVTAAISAASLSTHANTRYTSNAYDNAGRLAFTTNAERYVTAFSYDSAGNVVKTIEYAAQRPSTAYASFDVMTTWAAGYASDTQNRISRDLYNPAGQLIYQVDAENFVTKYEYDGGGRKMAQTRYASGYTVTDASTITSLAATISSPTTAVTQRFTYDPLGRMIESYDGLGIQTRYEYDAQDRMTATIIDNVTTKFEYDAAGQLVAQTSAWGTAVASTVRSEYDGLGNRVSATDGNGQTTYYAYDALGNVITVTTPTGTGASAQTSYAYDGFGNRISTTDPRGNIIYNTYDRLNRLTYQVDQEGFVTKTDYDIAGNATAITRFGTTATASGPAIVPTVPSNATDDAVTSFIYNKLDQITQTTDALGAQEQYTYDSFGNKIQTINKLGGKTTYAYDENGRLKEEDVYYDGYIGKTLYGYDSRNNLLSKTEAYGRPEQRITQYAYDKNDRLILTTYPPAKAIASATDAIGSLLSGQESLSYDQRGNIIEAVDAAGGRTLYYYDGLNRKVAQITESGSAGQGVLSK